MELCEKNKQWLEDVWAKLQTKMSAEVDRVGDKIPYIPENGVYVKDMSSGNDMKENNDLFWWTNGFWPGMLWQMYHATGDERYKTAAEGVEKKLDAALADASGLHHDVGFMWLHSAVADYRLTGNEQSKVRGLHAANLLAGRYNPDGKFIRAWNGDRTGWIIVDCMMNVPLLHWAYEQTGDPRYRQIAMHHADTVLDKIVREDGSCYHIVALNPETGEVDFYPPCQGYDPEGSWSRGQAWAIYGFAISYKHTGEKRYLDAAKKVAHYFLANVAQTGNIPLIDFRQPAEPVWYDSTAAACAACGMLEIANSVPELEKSLYVNGAVNMMKATMEKFCNWDPSYDSILGGGSVAYHRGENQIHVPIIYGDYFMIEFILRLMDKDLFIW